MADEERARWTRLIADLEVSDLTQAEFAQERGISLSNLRQWLYRLRKERGASSASAQAGSAADRSPRRKHSRLLPVRMVASRAPKAREAEDSAVVIELALATGLRLRFPVGTDLYYLRQLATAL